MNVGSPTAAIISFLNIITNMLLTDPYVIVIALDFSKAFDTVRHFTLLEKMAQLDMPGEAYNWLVAFFSGHSHCTVYQGQMSNLKGYLGHHSQHRTRFKHRTSIVCGQCR